MPKDIKYSTKHITQTLLSDVVTALKDLEYGSIELFVVDGEVTQITKRQIRKTRTTLQLKRD